VSQDGLNELVCIDPESWMGHEKQKDHYLDRRRAGFDGGGL
jgi:hypothetical protein